MESLEWFMSERIKRRLGFLILSIPFLFGFIFIPHVSCEEMEITILGRLSAGIVSECFAAVSAVILVVGTIWAFDKKVASKLSKINGEHRVDFGR